MPAVSKNKLEMLRKRYPGGTMVCLDAMEGEEQMASGLKGRVICVDDAGQLQVQWENGSGLALIPGVDQFHKVSEPVRKKNQEGPSR